MTNDPIMESGGGWLVGCSFEKISNKSVPTTQRVSHHVLPPSMPCKKNERAQNIETNHPTVSYRKKSAFAHLGICFTHMSGLLPRRFEGRLAPSATAPKGFRRSKAIIRLGWLGCWVVTRNGTGSTSNVGSMVLRMDDATSSNS